MAAALRKGNRSAAGQNVETLFAVVPEPQMQSLDQPYGIMVTGVGGTGVVTIGAIVGMAAHLENKGFGALDMAGLAQKGGAVWSHLQIAAKPEDIKTVRLGSGGAKLVLGCDFVVSASQKTMDTVREGARMVVNTHQQMTGDFTRDANVRFPAQSLRRTIQKGVGEANAEFVDATRIATALLGDSIATNLFMLGHAFQRGLVPVSSDAINKAIELNGTAVKMNQAAFLWGRRAAVDLAAIERLIAARPDVAPAIEIAQTLEQVVARRVEFLTGYQNAAYAAKYVKLVERVKQAETTRAKGLSGLAEAVARYYFKLLAYKDEYEVARLYADPAFMDKIKSQFEGDYKLHFHLAPPLLAKRDPATGELRKAEYGTWVFTAFKLLARLRGLRGTAFDVFGYTRERRMERQLIREYEAMVEELIDKLSLDNHALAVKIASIPEDIRGYGHVKDRHLVSAQARQAQLLEAYRSPEKVRSAA